MPKVVKELGALAVSRLDKPGRHAVGGVAGLELQIAPGGARTWVLRTTVGGKRREIGLGGYPTVSLADARQRAREQREAITAGRDPLAERRAAKSALLAAQEGAKSFEEAALAYIAAHEAGWRDRRGASVWRRSLEMHAFPKLGRLLVRDINTEHVLAVLEPIWKTTTETAVRVRSRIELILDWATVRGYRSGLNPARWKGHLDKLLARPSKVAVVKNHAAVPVEQVGAFMAALRHAPGQGARCLEFVILTAARSGEARAARWSEIDLEARMWTVPAERMKAGREHRVPLSDAAVALLESRPKIGADADPLVFPAPRGGVLSDMTLTATIKRMDEASIEAGGAGWRDPKQGGRVVTAHGTARSTFRDWAAERTGYPREVAEMALAHTIESKVEGAYRRGDLFDKRARLMADWASFLSIQDSNQTAAVIPMRAAG